MKPMDDILVTPEQREALAEIKRRLLEKFDVMTIVLFGSLARGQADDESDADLLIVMDRPLTRFQRHEITNEVFDVNLQYDTNFSTLVVGRQAWETGMVSVLPIHDEILRDGVQV